MADFKKYQRGSALFLAAAVSIAAPRSSAAAPPIGENMPIPGGTAAMAKSLGIDRVPDRPRFVAELVRVIYEAPESKNPQTVAGVDRLTRHMAVVAKFGSALAAVQPRGVGIALTLAASKKDRARLKDFLDLVGLKLREKNKTFIVEGTDNKLASDRVRQLSALGIDLGNIAARLNAGETVRIEVPVETVPVPMTVRLWSEAVFQRPVTLDTLFAAIMSDARAALLARGLAGLDDETLKFLAGHPAMISRLYEHDAAPFAAFADALSIRGGRVVPAGGVDGARAWEAVLGEEVARPEQFVRALFEAADGRTALLYSTLAHLDAPHVAFALGSWMPDPADRISQFKTLANVLASRTDWEPQKRPFDRPTQDVTTLLTRVRVIPNGLLARPSERRFWDRAFESADLPDDPARRLRNLDEEGVATAGWLAEAVCRDLRNSAERLDQLAFGQRAFGTAADLNDALLAVRALPRYRMLMLTLDRMGIRAPQVYAASARHAERISALDGRRRFIALAQYQGAIAILSRLVRVHALSVDQTEKLVTSLAALELDGDGAYGAGVARWINRQLGPTIKWTTPTTVDEDIVRSLAGAVEGRPPAPTIAWEGRTYRVDVVAAEQRRLARAREKMGAVSMTVPLGLERVAGRLLGQSLTVADARASLLEIKAFAASIPPPDKKTAAVSPPAVEPAKNPLSIVERAQQELSRISTPKELKRAARVAESLSALVDELLAQSLMSLAYAVDIGSPDGTTLMGGDPSRRHDFGFDNPDGERRLRTAWAAPRQQTTPGVPWHVSGALLALDDALSALILRRVDTGELPAPPVLTQPDRETFSRTVAFMNPLDFTDAGRDTIVAALTRGRALVSALTHDGVGWDELADRVRLDGWRRQAGRWALANDAAIVPSFFSLRELVELGNPPADAPLDRWGVASDGTDACICNEAAAPGRIAIMTGRPQLGLLSFYVPDVGLRVAELLAEAHLPASLARGVLAAAMLDFIDRVRPLHADDWLTLVRTAQAISKERVEDYVATLTADGPLLPERSTSQQVSR